MSIKFYTLFNEVGTAGKVILVDTEESFDNLKRLVSRALNCWDNAPVELKELGDILEYGRVMQDYAHLSQPMMTKKVRPQSIYPEGVELPVCADCGRAGAGHLYTCPALTKK